MALARVTVRATETFLFNLNEAFGFFREQDAQTAPARVARLKAGLREMVEVLAWAPGGGRPARFLASASAQARIRVAALLQAATEAGIPYLREYVIEQHIVLYAHSDAEVLLLAIRHQRQLTYVIP